MSRKTSRWILLSSASALAALGAFGPPAEAMAAEAAARPSGEVSVDAVVVTARRRAETLLEAPVTVTAVTGELLRSQGVTQLRDIVALVPNAVIQDNPESFNTFVNIRGMRIVDVQAEPNVGLYRNGMYIGGHRANLGSQVDVERVEILRGPQGGFYGRSSVGGTVDLIYATPGETFGGYVKATAGSYKLTKLEGAVNVPMGEAGALRLTAWSFNQSESELFNETLNEYVGAYDDRGVRLGYKLDLSDRLTVQWTAEGSEFTGPSMKTYAPFGISNFGPVSTPETPQRIRRDTRSDAKKRELYLAQVVRYDSDMGRFTLNASYKRYDFDSIQDSDQTAIGPEASPVARQTDILRDEGTRGLFVEALWSSKSEGPLSWMLGASYFDETFKFARTIQSRRNTPSFGIRTALIGFPNKGTTVDTETLSAFVTLGYQFSPALSAEASLRYSEDKKSLSYAQGVLPTGTGDAALDTYFRGLLGGPYPTYGFNSDSKFTNWSPSLTLKYKVNEDVNLYASYSTGFRPGAFNLSPTTPQTIPYGQETAENYEAGLKGRFMGGAANVTLAAFLMRQKDLLLAQTTSLGGVDRTFLDNVGTARTYGLEAELQIRPTDWLTGGLSIGWLDPKFDDAVANRGLPTQQVLSGKMIPYTREWTANLRVDVDYPVSSSLDLVGGVAVRYEKGGVLGDYYVIDPYDTMTKIDLNMGVRLSGRTRISAYVHNLLDENISQFWFYNRGTNTSEGRTVGLDISHSF